jgi:hypothetical protein
MGEQDNYSNEFLSEFVQPSSMAAPLFMVVSA